MNAILIFNLKFHYLMRYRVACQIKSWKFFGFCSTSTKNSYIFHFGLKLHFSSYYSYINYKMSSKKVTEFCRIFWENV